MIRGSGRGHRAAGPVTIRNARRADAAAIVTCERRREGIGSRRVGAGERRLRERGARRVAALVGSDDRIARSLWGAAGYEPDPCVARFVRNL